MKEEDKNFHFVYKTEEDLKNELIQWVDENIETAVLLEGLQWEGKSLYERSSGHDFVLGFYIEYVTKDYVRLIRYLESDVWTVKGSKYKIVDNEFVLIPNKPKSETTRDISELKFPVVKNVKFPTKSFTDDIKPVQPIDPDGWDKINLDLDEI